MSFVIIFLFLLGSSSVRSTFGNPINTTEGIPDDGNTLNEYTAIDTNPHVVTEDMKLSPLFTPDNAVSIYEGWLSRANSTIEIQNQYITKFDDSVDWSVDANPIVRGIVDAADRGVDVKVQVREDSDSDDVTSYLNSITNIEVRWMGSSTSSSDNSWLSSTHNKLVIIDRTVTIISSINFGENAFLNNREAGMVVQSSSVSNYFFSFFDEDWTDGEIPPSSTNLSTSNVVDTKITPDYTSPTDIPRTNFSGTYTVSAYVNPDNADQHIFDYLQSAQESIYVSMYTISRQDFVDTLVNLKQNNPSLDIQVLISNRRVGSSENIDTHAAAEELTNNQIPVYNSTEDLNFYHNKYWIIDGKHTFIYSGNWSPRSVTPVESDNTYGSSTSNRDMGIAVHDATDIADFIKTEVWDNDVAAADAWELPVGITQTSFDRTEVVSGTVNLAGTINGLSSATVSYRFGSSSFTEVSLSGDSFSVSFDTTTIENGITEFSVRAETSSQTFIDSVMVNVANYPSDDNWRLLITEVHPDPDNLDDSDGEFVELTNSFPFSLLIEGWKFGDGTSLMTFPSLYQIDAYSSIIFSANPALFEPEFGVTSDFELGPSLTNTGDFVQLLDYADNIIDAVAYGSASAPDGSETVQAPGSGESINRDPLAVDTNQASDFSIGAPTPKGNVPQVPLGDVPETDDFLPLLISPMVLLFVVLPLLRRKEK